MDVYQTDSVKKVSRKRRGREKGGGGGGGEIEGEKEKREGVCVREKGGRRGEQQDKERKRETRIETDLLPQTQAVCTPQLHHWSPRNRRRLYPTLRLHISGWFLRFVAPLQPALYLHLYTVALVVLGGGGGGGGGGGVTQFVNHGYNARPTRFL